MDNIFANLFRYQKREAQAAPATGTKTEGGNVHGGSFVERVVHARSPQVALTVSAVYRAVELRAKTIGQMAVQYQTKTLDGGNYVQAMWGPGKRLNYLLQVEPNPLMSASVLWEQVTIARLMEGNGFVYIERDDLGDPVRLWLADCAGYNELAGTYTLTEITPPTTKKYLKADGVLKITIGKDGLAVVADEIRGLASQSADAVSTIDNMLNELNESVETTVKQRDAVRKAISKQEESVNLTGEKYAAIVEKIEAINNEVHTLDELSVNMDKSCNAVVSAVNNLTDSAATCAANSEETSASTAYVQESMSAVTATSNDMNELATRLKDILSEFNL